MESKATKLQRQRKGDQKEERETDSKYSSAGLVALVALPLLSKRVMQLSVFQGLLHRVHGSSVLKEAMR